MKIGLSAVGKIYCVFGLPQNARTCLYGFQISEFSQLEPALLEDYFQ